MVQAGTKWDCYAPLVIGTLVVDENTHLLHRL